MKRKRLFIKTRLLDMSISVMVALVVVHFLSHKNVDVKKQSDVEIQVCFSPGGHCDDLLVGYIKNAKKTIYVHAYSFTRDKISNALIERHKSGVHVSILYDKSSAKSKHSQIPNMKKAGIDVQIDRTRGLAHNKIMILDEKLVVTGSYNWSKSAEFRNAENMLFISDMNAVKQYKNNWFKRYNRVSK